MTSAVPIAGPIVQTASFLRAGGDDLFSVITSPTAPSDAGVIVLTGGRFTSSAGRNRVGLRTAEELAASGYEVLRLDYHGVGDSTGRVDDFVLHEPFIDDCNAAVDALHQRGRQRIGLLGDCFGARTALAACVETRLVESLMLVSLPWRDLARSNRKATIVSSELSMGDYVKRGVRGATVRNLFNANKRRDYRNLVEAKGRQIIRRASDRIRGAGVEPWVSHRVIEQLSTVRTRGVPTLLLYGQGPAEDYAGDFAALRTMAGLAWLNEAGGVVRSQVLDQPIAGYRNVVSQNEVISAAVTWFTSVMPPEPR